MFNTLTLKRKLIDIAILDFSARYFIKFHTGDYPPNLNTLEYGTIEDSGLIVSYLGGAKK